MLHRIAAALGQSIEIRFVPQAKGGRGRRPNAAILEPLAPERVQQKVENCFRWGAQFSKALEPFQKPANANYQRVRLMNHN